jgi:hypothetical protein
MQATTVSGSVTGASTKTLVSVLASATRRAKLKQISVACTDTPADATAIFRVCFITADGTGTAETTQAVDSADGAPSCTSKKNYTIEPTYASQNIWEEGLNQRVSMIWNAPFGGEFVTNLSGGTNLGIGLQMISGPALTYRATLQWEE